MLRATRDTRGGMLRATLLLAALLLRFTRGRCGSEADGRGPVFTVEPPSLVYYLRRMGVHVHCVAAGQPTPALTWLALDDSALHERTSTRRVYDNGTLEVLPELSPGAATTAAERVEGEGVLTVRCRAHNALGAALSRDVTLQPVSEGEWEMRVVVAGGGAAAGGVAALECGAVPARVPLRRVRWFRADAPLLLGAPTPESRYIAAGDMLLIRDVTAAADAGPYVCEASHALSDVTKRSPPVLLAVTAVSTRWAPRLASAPADVRAHPGQRACLPCLAPLQPAPHYTWYREAEGRLQPVEEGASAWLWAGGAALCALPPAPGGVEGAWLCKAYNAFGDAARHVRLHLDAPLTVTVTPAHVVAAAGETVRLSCLASERGARLQWLHDARALPAAARVEAGGTLAVRVSRRAQGVYQCRARTLHDNAQGTALLLLGDSPPELQYTFIEQALRAGGSVSLRCAVSGTPPPRLAWLLDDQPLEQYRPHRYLMSSETTAHGEVVSMLNISAVSTADGGRYSCRASNRLGDVDHSARLNIYGPPSIRAAGPVRVVAGSNVTVHCPYSGYPISSVEWRRHGSGAVLDVAGRVTARGGVLRLAPVLPVDAGLYACSVVAPGDQQARRDIEIQVRNPPKISPFMFSSELTEGSSAQVLCGVSSGDKPMYFSWTKDGAPLPANLQIEEKSLNEFSLLMFSEVTARHSGAYTCRVSNHAAARNYTAVLSVKVAPAWVTEPLDAAVLLGAPILLECAAKGYPIPTVTWYRKIDESGSGPESDQWELADGEAPAPPGKARGAGRGVVAAPAAARRHQGVYRCLADNGIGPSLVKLVNLTVHEPAHFESSAGNISCVRGSGASLWCLARGDAPLAVRWTRRGAALDLNSYRWSVSEEVAAGGVRSTLRLRAAARGDAGAYRCLAHNHYGRSELIIYLHVEEPPEAPRMVRLKGVGSRWVRVQWHAGGEGGAGGMGAEERYSALCTALHTLAGTEPPHTTFNLTLDTQNDRRAAGGAEGLGGAGGSGLVAQVEGLRPAAAYSLRIVAENHVGRSPHSEPLLFTTLDEAPSAPPRNVQVRPAAPGELLVSWSAPAQDSWNGELLGYVVTWRDPGRSGLGAEEPGRSGRVTSRGWSSGATTLAGLRGGARLGVAVRAFSRAGVGPASPHVYATTADGVPEEPPGSVSCEAGHSRALQVRWTELLDSEAPRSYDVHYVPLYPFPPWSGAAAAVSVRGVAATLQGLAAGTNYSVWVCARVPAGPGPPSAPALCRTLDDVPGAVTDLRVLAARTDTLRVTWLPPAPPPTHYTLYTRELGKSHGAERALRVEGGTGGEEVRRDVRGLRSAPHHVWVVAVVRMGEGTPSRPVTATPGAPGAARISSLGRTTVTSRGASVRLRCAALGSPPLRWSWSPLPPTHSITETGDLIVHKAELALSGNYTCSVRNAGGADAVQHHLVVLGPPSAPVPRLLRAEPHALHVAWPAPLDAETPLLGYTVRWAREASEGAPDDATSRRELPGAAQTTSLRWLVCGAWYRVTLQAHGVGGASPLSVPLRARTEGDKAVPAPGEEFVWSNSTALRFNLLAWRVRCAPVYRLALRAAVPGAAPWTPLDTDQESAQAGGLQPGTWYEVHVEARAQAGDTRALYRAATRAATGERIGEAMEVTAELRSSQGGGAASAGPGPGAGVGAWPASLAVAMLGALLAALLVVAAGLLARRVRGRGGACGRRGGAAKGPPPQPQLYSTEPAAKREKTLMPPEGDMDEISPYATFSMSGGGEGAGAAAGCPAPPAPPAPPAAGPARGECALHLGTFGRSAQLEGGAPSRPNLLSHTGVWCEYGGARDTDSESSGSPCAACRPPAPPDATGAPRRRRRHAAPPTHRYFSPSNLEPGPGPGPGPGSSRQEAL